MLLPKAPPVLVVVRSVLVCLPRLLAPRVPLLSLEPNPKLWTSFCGFESCFGLCGAWVVVRRLLGLKVVPRVGVLSSGVVVAPCGRRPQRVLPLLRALPELGAVLLGA